MLTAKGADPMQIHFDEGATEKSNRIWAMTKVAAYVWRWGGSLFAACDDPYAGPVLT